MENGAASMSASDRGWAIVGNPGCRRVEAWKAALARHRVVPSHISYEDLLGDNPLPTRAAGCHVRLESAAENPRTYRLLLKLGYAQAHQNSYPVIEPDQVDALPFERGLLHAPRQAHWGFERLLKSAGALRLGNCHYLNQASEIALQYDKTATLSHLQHHGLPVPEFADEVVDYESIRERFRSRGRVMVKLRHGSGGAGCMAIHWSKMGTRAFATVLEEFTDGKSSLYAAKKPRYLRDETEIAYLVNRLVHEGLHAEAWLPKARDQGHNFDLRIVTIAGKATHAVARGSHHTFTNLNLGNRRLVLQPIIARLGTRWGRLIETAEQAAACFPDSYTLGIDMLLHADWKRWGVLEVNAFGNQLHGITDARGLSTYEAAVDSLMTEPVRP